MIRRNVITTAAKFVAAGALAAVGLSACSDSDESSTPDAGVLFVLDTPSSVVEESGVV